LRPPPRCVCRIVRHACAARAEDDAREILDIDLVHDAGVGRNDAKSAQRALPPLQECVSLAITLELQRGVFRKRIGSAKEVDLHGVIHHQLHRLQRIDCRGRSAHLRNRVAHGGEVDDTRHAGEILQEHARRPERDLAILRHLLPARERLDILALYRPAVFEAQQILQ
jgi:hypothetical protein